MVTLIPTFILFGELEWIDTFNPVILPYLLGTPFALFLSRQFFSGLPRELEDAAKVDGAGFFQIYLRVFLPQARPLVATLFVLGYLHRWNDFLAPLIYLRSPEIQTVSVMLARTGGHVCAGLVGADGRGDDSVAADSGAGLWRCSVSSSRAWPFRG